jgi:hypothetical protein
MLDLESFREWPASKKAGLVISILSCVLPALTLNGFGLEIRLGMPLALGIAVVGGALGGILLCRRPLRAGLVGGLLTGPCGLMAVYAYTYARHRVWNVEIALVLLVGCLPGILVGYAIKRKIEDREFEAEGEPRDPD